MKASVTKREVLLTLTMTDSEAALFVLILTRIGGAPGGPRGIINSWLQELRSAGTDACDSPACINGGITLS